MTYVLGAAFVAAVFGTSLISGVFGMAGGLILLGLLLLVLPVGTAIAIQGAIQLIANGSRAWMSREWIDWRVMGLMTAGLLSAALLLAILRYVPDLVTVCITVGLLPILLWVPQRWLALDASKPHHAFLCGFLGGGLNLAVGVAGPVMDMFFIRTAMDRRVIIATKAAGQVINHSAKIVFYWQAALVLTGWEWGAVALAAPFAILGTRAGHWVLQRLTDARFKSWTRLIVTAIGIYYLVRGISLLI